MRVFRRVLALGVMLSLPALAQAQPAYRTLHFNIDEVTQPDLAVSANGKMLIFSALGHLQRIPVAGGAAEQLTFGPAYDSDPVVSPDGRRVAFVSNRDGSGSNVFVLELASGQVTQVSHELYAAMPAWSPDGKTIAYVRNLQREEHSMALMPGFHSGGVVLRELRTVPASGGEPAVMAKPQPIGSVFYLPDGRLGFTVGTLSGRAMFGASVSVTHVEALGKDGSVTEIATAKGDLGRVALGSKGDGLYYTAGNTIDWLPFAADAQPVAGPRASTAIGRIAVGNAGDAVYFGGAGGLWRASLPAGKPLRIAFSAKVAMDVRPPVEPRWVPPDAAPVRNRSMRPALAPTLAPDGQTLIVMAGGFLWAQPLAPGATAHRLLDSNAFKRGPVYSPDGSKLAFIAMANGKRALKVYDFATQKARTLYEVGGASWPLFPSFSPDGKRIVFQHSTRLGAPFGIVVVDVASGETRQVARTVGSWIARPQFSRDGTAIFYTNRPGKWGTLYRLALTPGAKPEAVTDLSRHVHQGVVSPDGHWLAFRRNSEIWIAPMRKSLIGDADIHRLSLHGGRGFAFTPDSSAVIYTSAGRVFRQPVEGSPRTEIVVRATMPRAVAPPLLLTNVRVLSYTAGGFGNATSLFIENGRIKWIGNAAEHTVPDNVVRLDGAGRYAIPGLMDVHVHSAWANEQANPDAFIAYGVTSVRDTGGRLGLLNALDDRSNITDLPVPRYFYSGEIMEGLMPLWGDAFNTIGTAEEMRAEVRNTKAGGADFIKIYPSLPWRLQGVIADEAHRVGMPIVGHGLSVEETIRRVVWGSTSIEHSSTVISGHADIYAMLATAHIPVPVTYDVFHRALAHAQDPGWKTDWRAEEYVPAACRNQSPRRPDDANLSVPQLLAQSAPDFHRIKAAHDAGVALRIGTDAEMSGVCFGQATHWEIANFVDAGLKPIDVLRMSTLGGAELVGAANELGSITPGKFGDIVLLDRNPLENIQNTQTIWRVLKGGHVYDPRLMRAQPGRL